MLGRRPPNQTRKPVCQICLHEAASQVVLDSRKHASSPGGPWGSTERSRGWARNPSFSLWRRGSDGCCFGTLAEDEAGRCLRGPGGRGLCHSWAGGHDARMPRWQPLATPSPRWDSDVARTARPMGCAVAGPHTPNPRAGEGSPLMEAQNAKFSGTDASTNNAEFCLHTFEDRRQTAVSQIIRWSLMGDRRPTCHAFNDISNIIGQDSDSSSSSESDTDAKATQQNIGSKEKILPVDGLDKEKGMTY